MLVTGLAEEAEALHLGADLRSGVDLTFGEAVAEGAVGVADAEVLHHLGARVFVNIPGSGYVGVGEVIGGAQRFDEATVEIDGVEVTLSQQQLVGSYNYPGGESDDIVEWVVPSWKVMSGLSVIVHVL